jgi:hypothetical protein
MEARSHRHRKSNAQKKDEMNFIFPLDAFSWKTMQRTATRCVITFPND